MGNAVCEVIDFEQLQKKNYKPKEFNINYEDIYDDLFLKFQKLVNNTVEEQISNQIKGTPHIIELERKCENMKKKLEHAIPYHTIIYMCVSGAVFTVAVFLLYLRFGKNLYVIDPYYLICASLVSLGLFLTALVSLKDWKEYLLEDETKSRL